MRQTSCVLYIAIDALIPHRGDAIPGFGDFIASLDHAGIPSVWLTSRTRLQIDEPRRKLAHTHPFIAEDGCGVFLPEDYFHLRPKVSSPSPSQTGKASTVRLGRFTCLPIAQPQPTAAEALEAVSADTGIEVAPLSSLTPRELAQNLNLPARDAEFARQRDFDELFFFPGGSPKEVEKFKATAQAKGCQVRQRAALWSLAVGASVSRCIRELTKLYDRALHAHARTIGLAMDGHENDLFRACDRAVLLIDNADRSSNQDPPQKQKVMELPLHSPGTWTQLLTTAMLR